MRTEAEALLVTQLHNTIVRSQKPVEEGCHKPTSDIKKPGPLDTMSQDSKINNKLGTRNQEREEPGKRG